MSGANQQPPPGRPVSQHQQQIYQPQQLIYNTTTGVQQPQGGDIYNNVGNVHK